MFQKEAGAYRLMSGSIHIRTKRSGLTFILRFRSPTPQSWRRQRLSQCPERIATPLNVLHNTPKAVVRKRGAFLKDGHVFRGSSWVLYGSADCSHGTGRPPVQGCNPSIIPFTEYMLNTRGCPGLGDGCLAVKTVR